MNERMTQVNVYLDPEKHARLATIAAREKRSMGSLIREGIMEVVDIATKQQDTLDRALKEYERRNRGQR